jgi:hypothetical protein
MNFSYSYLQYSEKTLSSSRAFKWHAYFWAGQESILDVLCIAVSGANTRSGKAYVLM